MQARPTPPGDVNLDYEVGVSDAVMLLRYLFADGEKPACEAASDANQDRRTDISDAIEVLGAALRGGPPPEGGEVWCIGEG